MNAARVFGKGMAFPPRIGAGGSIEWSEGERNIEESIKVILLTQQNERMNLPLFGAGLREYLFEPNTVEVRHSIKERITRSLEQWEPRIQIDSVSVEQDPDDPRTAIATIAYRLTATRDRRQMSLTIGFGS